MATRAASWSAESVATLRKGLRPQAKATSDLKTLPRPAMRGLIEEGEAEFEIGARGEVGDGDCRVEAGGERRGARGG